MREVELNQNRFWKKMTLSAAALFLPLLFFHSIEFLQAFESRCLDFMMALRGARNSNPNVVLVTMDDQTGRQLGTPLPRRYYAQVIRALHQYGAKVIVVDLMILNRDASDPYADTTLTDMTQQFRNVIHSFFLSADYEIDSPVETETKAVPDTAYAKFAVTLQDEKKLTLIAADSITLPPPFFLERFPKAGIISMFTDSDGLYRRLPLFFKYGKKLYPTLSLAALCDYWQVPPEGLGVKQSLWGYDLAIKTANEIIKIPIDHTGLTLLNFDGSFQTFKSYSIVQILKALKDIEERRAPQISLHDFAGKIVVIGNNETIGKDYFPTPLAEDFPGMAIQATALSNFLNGNALRELPWYMNVGFTLLLGAMLSTGLMLAGKAAKTREAVFQWIILGTIVLFFNLLAYFLLFKTFHLVPAMLSTNSALVLLFVATAFYEKTLSVKMLHRQVTALEKAMAEKDSHIQVLNTRIHTQDEQYKAIEFFTGELESVLNNPATERPHAIATPLMKMQIFKEQLRTELEQRRTEKQLLEAEKDKLASQVMAYKNLAGDLRPEGKAALAELTEPQRQEKFEEANRIMESYRAFAQKIKAPYHYDPALGMVTAVMNGYLNGQTHRTKMQEVLAQIARLSPFDATVLISGDSGTGKEMVAEAICNNSRRKDGPFVKVNCGAIPEGLIESEFFGHEKGAFSGAIAEHAGYFEQANGGTIFLDEIGELPLALQTRLLRVLQDKKVRRVGGKKDIEVDVRVIAATNRDLQKLMQNAQFREDLYFRLDVVNIHMPRLRERKDEIPPLVYYFLSMFYEQNKVRKRISDQALMAFILHDWPGNIRALHNEVEKACINSLGETIHLTDLSAELQRGYREIFSGQQVPLWEAIESAVKIEMENLLEKCREMLRATDGVETALQSGLLTLWGVSCENCYEYVKAYIDGKGASFPLEQREKMAKQTIVTMAELLNQWCREQKLGRPMQQNWEEIEKLLGRTRRMIDNWKRELGMGTPGLSAAN